MTSVRISVNNVSLNIKINNNDKLSIDIVDNDLSVSLDCRQIDDSKVTFTRPNNPGLDDFIDVNKVKVCTPDGIYDYLQFVDDLGGYTKKSDLWIINNHKEELKIAPKKCIGETEYETKALKLIKEYLGKHHAYEVTWMHTITQKIIDYHRETAQAFRNSSIKDSDRFEDDSMCGIMDFAWIFQYKLYKDMYCLLHYYLRENQVKEAIKLITYKQLKWEEPPEIDMWTQCYLWSVESGDILVGDFLKTNYFSN